MSSAPMAAQMAQLLAASDHDELQEIVKRWLSEAPTERIRQQYAEFGSRLLELKAALKEAPVQPTRQELETALTMMMNLAASHATGLPKDK